MTNYLELLNPSNDEILHAVQTGSLVAGNITQNQLDNLAARLEECIAREASLDASRQMIEDIHGKRESLFKIFEALTEYAESYDEDNAEPLITRITTDFLTFDEEDDDLVKHLSEIDDKLSEF